ncbi:MAG: glucose-1-phosphate thymidylyltransferase [Candidatus Magnetoovum sp. WYHC-5]|nr:glucose-1-phosphate thymidylyltransferase [Candidatus Magnetoovum sp. WYHC-5]
MKALVLSGGKGTRLRPLTHTIAKQLVPVAGVPILGYVLGHIASAAIVDVGIIISPETGNEVKEYVQDGGHWNINVTYILQENPLGLAHAVLMAREFIGEDDFIMYLGDNLLSSGLKNALSRFLNDRPEALIFLKEVENPQNFGVARLDREGNIVELIEKPLNPPSKLALVGVYMFTAKIFDAIRQIKPSRRGELEITDAIDWLIKNGYTVQSEQIGGWWLDTGKKDDLLEANTIVLDEYVKQDIRGFVDDNSSIMGRVEIAAGTHVKASTIRGPVRIGENSLISNAFIGPYTSIGSNVRIVNSVIEHSVILNDSTIEGIERLEDSLLGRYTTVIHNAQKHKALRLMISDNSVVEV